jgi:hypothetical protein
MSFDETSETAEQNESSQSLDVNDLYEELQQRINNRIQIASQGLKLEEPSNPWEATYEDIVDTVLQQFSLYVGLRHLEEEVKSYVS